MLQIILSRQTRQFGQKTAPFLLFSWIRIYLNWPEKQCGKFGLLHWAPSGKKFLATGWLLTFIIAVLHIKLIKHTRVFRKVPIYLQKLTLYYKNSIYQGDMLILTKPLVCRFFNQIPLMSKNFHTVNVRSPQFTVRSKSDTKVCTIELF